MYPSGEKLIFTEQDRALCHGLPAEAPRDSIDSYRSKVSAQTEAVRARLHEVQTSPIFADRSHAAELSGRLSALNTLSEELAEAAHYVQNDAVENELQAIIFRG